VFAVVSGGCEGERRAVGTDEIDLRFGLDFARLIGAVTREVEVVGFEGSRLHDLK